MSDSSVSWHDLGPVEVQPESRVFDIGTDEVWILRRNGSFTVVSNICPHKMGPISEGILEGDVIECPWHGFRFNICSGVSDGSSCPALRVYETNVRDGRLFMREKLR